MTTTTALHTAALHVGGVDDNQEEVDVIARKLLTKLKSCSPQRTSMLRKPRKEAIWRSYFELRTFLSLWVEFLSKAVSVEAHPIMFQYVTDQVFQVVVEELFGQSSTGQYATVEAVTYKEGNALRYVAGYVCHKLRKITASKLPLRGKLLLCLMDLCDEDGDTSGSADCVHAVDRGGLVRVSESTYLLFERMELIIRTVFNTYTVHTMTEEVKKDLQETIISDADIAFHWSMLTVEVEDVEGAVLLEMIVGLFITIRGFSLKSLMEMYKQEVKKSTQMSKSLQRKLTT